jgi:hypothetical protein
MYRVIHADVDNSLVETLGLFRYYTDASNSAFGHAQAEAEKKHWKGTVKFEYPDGDYIRPAYTTGNHRYTVLKT